MKSHSIVLVSLSFLLMFTLSACVSATQTPVAADVQPVATEEQPVATEVQLVEPQTAKEAILRVGWSSEPDTMNPLTTYSTEAMEVIALVYDKLLVYDLTFKTQPSLAEEYTYSDDGLTLTFKLRQGVKWHDGKPLSAEDAAFTFNLIKDSELSMFVQWLAHMTSATAPDANTFVLTFDLPQSFNPGLAIPILPKHIWSSMSAEDVEAFPNDKPIGT